MVRWFRGLDLQIKVALISALFGGVFGGIGGIAGPLIQGKIQQIGDTKKLNLEADLARQTKFIDAQSQFLTDISRALWDWRYVSIKVAYYGGTPNVNSEKYKEAFEGYDKRIWDLLSSMRLLISQSNRLVSERVFHDLQNFYPVAVELDKLISAAASEGDAKKRENEFQRLNSLIFEDISTRIDAILLEISKDFGVARSSLPLARER
jgi:hypothetical protein